LFLAVRFTIAKQTFNHLNKLQPKFIEKKRKFLFFAVTSIKLKDSLLIKKSFWGQK